MAISVAGGDLQDQVTLNLLLNVIEFDMRPELAVTAPRFATAHHQDSFDPNPNRIPTFIGAGSLILNDSVDRVVLEELSQRGHQIETTASPIASPVMLYVDQDSCTFYAAGDPKAHRHAAGLGGK
jgi:gamma-glutamyltranspeptidase